jgi:hypothetical protein
MMSEKKKQCALGFDCAGMMLFSPGIDPADCANFLSCRAALGLEPDTEFELARYNSDPQEQYLETIRLTRTSAARMMLIKKWDDSGRLPAIRTDGGHRRYRQSDVYRFMGTEVEPLINQDVTAVYCRVSSHDLLDAVVHGGFPQDHTASQKQKGD